MEQNYNILKDMPYFNRSTLGDILTRSGENLKYRLKKLTLSGEIIGLKNGLYVSSAYLLTLEKNAELYERYLEYLANIIRSPSYISLEYALSRYGVIPEGVYAITSITLKTTRTYNNKLGSFIYRNIKESLFEGFENLEFEGKRVKMATKAKALFDFLYLRKGTLVDDLRFNLDMLSKKDKIEFLKYVSAADSNKMRSISKKLKW